MGMNKNTVLGWATLIMVIMGLILIGLGIYRYADTAGWGFGTVGVGFLAIHWPIYIRNNCYQIKFNLRLFTIN
jgi:predicted transporter